MSLTDLQAMKPKMNRVLGLKKIDLDDIRANDQNIFPQGDIEELKENIRQNGLQKPLEVYEDQGLYILLGGHRRFSALVDLYMEDEIDSEVNCIIYSKPSDSTDELLQLISSNAQRTMDDKLKIDITKRLLLILEKHPEKRPKGMETREWISGYLGCSARTAQKYINDIKGKKEKKKPLRNNEFVYVESLIRDRFSTKVRVNDKKITISYTNVEDLNRVLELMGCIEKGSDLEVLRDV